MRCELLDKRSSLSVFHLRGKGPREDLMWLGAQETALLPELIKTGLEMWGFSLHEDLRLITLGTQEKV